MPAFKRTCAFGSSKEAGIVLLGKGWPGDRPSAAYCACKAGESWLAKRHGLVDKTALNELAPLHVVKEKGLVAVLVVVYLRNDYRSAGVETISIESQLRRFRPGGIGEKVACIQRIIAQELPRRSMEIFRSGLEGHGQRSGGGETVLSAVIGSERTELGDRVHRGHDADVAGTATVIIFATIHHVEVVRDTETVKTHRTVPAYRHRVLEIHHVARSASRESGQRINASAVGGKL